MLLRSKATAVMSPCTVFAQRWHSGVDVLWSFVCDDVHVHTSLRHSGSLVLNVRLHRTSFVFAFCGLHRWVCMVVWERERDRRDWGVLARLKTETLERVLRDLSGTVVRITPLPSPGLMGPRKREHSELVFRTRWDDRGKQRHKCSETHEMFQIEIRFIVAYQCFVVFDQSPVVAIDCLFLYLQIRQENSEWGHFYAPKYV